MSFEFDDVRRTVTYKGRRYRYRPFVDIIQVSETYEQGQTDYFEREKIPVEGIYASTSEFAGRLCYMSYTKPRPGGSKSYFERILSEAHGSVLEHQMVTVVVSGVSRSFTHELVRHRAGTAFSQQSQRYVDARNAAFIVPPLYHDSATAWIMDNHDLLEAMMLKYEKMVAKAETVTTTREKKQIREAAREILPNCTETHIVLSLNARAYRHIMEKRGAVDASLEMRMFSQILHDEIINNSRCRANGWHTILQDVIFSTDNGQPCVILTHKKV